MPHTSREFAFFELLEWLEHSGLTAKAPPYDRIDRQLGLLDPADQDLLGRPSHRAKRRTRAQSQQLREQLKGTDSVPRDQWAAIWAELRDPQAAIRQLDIARMPADAIAFYRPFHVEPVDQWGIYIFVNDLMRYLQSLRQSLGTLAAFPEDILATAVIFDVFHHEFFHHLVECAATTIEVIRGPMHLGDEREGPKSYSAAIGPRPCRGQPAEELEHEQFGNPLDEALARRISPTYSFFQTSEFPRPIAIDDRTRPSRRRPGRSILLTCARDQSWRDRRTADWFQLDLLATAITFHKPCSGQLVGANLLLPSCMHTASMVPCSQGLPEWRQRSIRGPRISS